MIAAVRAVVGKRFHGFCQLLVGSSHRSGIAHSAEVNFAPANFIITPPEKNRQAGIDWCRDLAAALGCFPAGLDSDVVYIDGGWELFVRTGDEALPNALFEFGEPLPCTEELYAHIGEHGDVVARRDAVGTLQRYFC